MGGTLPGEEERLAPGGRLNTLLNDEFWRLCVRIGHRFGGEPLYRAAVLSVSSRRLPEPALGGCKPLGGDDGTEGCAVEQNAYEDKNARSLIRSRGVLMASGHDRIRRPYALDLNDRRRDTIAVNLG